MKNVKVFKHLGVVTNNQRIRPVLYFGSLVFYKTAFRCVRIDRHTRLLSMEVTYFPSLPRVFAYVF